MGMSQASTQGIPPGDPLVDPAWGTPWWIHQGGAQGNPRDSARGRGATGDDKSGLLGIAAVAARLRSS